MIISLPILRGYFKKDTRSLSSDLAHFRGAEAKARRTRVACEDGIAKKSGLPSHANRASCSPRFRLCSPEIRKKSRLFWPVLQAICSSNLLLGDVHVAVAAVFCVRSLPELYSNRCNFMHQSIPAVPIPPGLTPGN